MSKLAFTRYLYIYDEVIISFITTLLKKQSLNESYFWISELFLSGYEKETWELIWFIYYDFYYITNPQFLSFIIKKHDYGLGNHKHLLTVVKNLFKLSISQQVFITRQYNCGIKKISTIFRGKKPNWLVKSIPLKYHVFFRYINKKLYHSAVSSIPEVDSDLFDAIQKYFNLSNDDYEHFKTIFANQSYDNDPHKIWSIICLLIFNPTYKDSKKQIFTTLTDDDYQNIIKQLNPSIPLNKNNENRVIETLKYRCLYPIHPLISSFNLMRDNEKENNNEENNNEENNNEENNNEENYINIKKCYCEHWEYYAYNSYIWKKRFDKYDITIDDINKKIVFNNDNQMEAFYNEFDYCPDEQSPEIQNKLFGSLPKNNWKIWFNEIFPDINSIYDFDDEFNFNY